MKWVFLGCPRVDKGTYTGRLLRLLGMPHIATGDFIRDELASQGPLSNQLLQFLADLAAPRLPHRLHLPASPPLPRSAAGGSLPPGSMST
ncbi:Adenylate kinase, chloroplastic [Hordeum vulgare]|nr:Adenylate kinase, chloroplastic [Hordeum vulgare]